MRTELALRRVTEVFATAERRRFALQIAENFARDPIASSFAQRCNFGLPFSFLLGKW
jgi:hypothetical protein